jgi:hypothetical protein
VKEATRKRILSDKLPNIMHNETVVCEAGWLSGDELPLTTSSEMCIVNKAAYRGAWGLCALLGLLLILHARKILPYKTITLAKMMAKNENGIQSFPLWYNLNSCLYVCLASRFHLLTSLFLSLSIPLSLSLPGVWQLA